MQILNASGNGVYLVLPALPWWTRHWPKLGLGVLDHSAGVPSLRQIHGRRCPAKRLGKSTQRLKCGAFGHQPDLPLCMCSTIPSLLFPKQPGGLMGRPHRLAAFAITSLLAFTDQGSRHNVMALAVFSRKTVIMQACCRRMIRW